MSGQELEKIERTRVLIRASPLPEVEREGLQELLDRAVHSANGVDNKIQAISETLLCLSTQWVRHVVGNQAIIAAAVKDHATACPLKDAPKGKIGIALQLAKSWPAMIAVSALAFSPHLPAILTAIREAFR